MPVADDAGHARPRPGQLLESAPVLDVEIDEPPAEWELAVGDDAADDAPARPAATDGRVSSPSDDRASRAAEPGPSGPSGQPGQYGQGIRPVERVAGGGQPQGQNGSGQGASGQNGAGQPGAGTVDGQAGEDGESRNRRRRRRRKGGARGLDGPQGDDGVVIDEVVATATVATTPDAVSGEQVEVEGYLDMRDEGYGFLRVKGYLPSRDDSYIPVKLARQYGLRKGDHITGLSRPAGRNEKNPALLEVHTVNGGDPEAAPRRAPGSRT